MTDLASLFDAYGRKARLYPALLAVLPVVAVVLAWLPTIPEATVLVSFASAAAAFGLLYILSNVARSAGKRTEKRLLKKWGGWPTTILLRHRCSSLPAPTRDRYHSYLRTAPAGLKVPTPAEEAADENAADDLYASAIHWLKEQRRGAAFDLLHKENADYGFRRNLRGLKPLGLTICVVSMAGWVLAFMLRNGVPANLHAANVGLQNTQPSAWLALGLIAISAVAWFVLVRDVWVREAADQYAVRLLATCDAPETKQAASGP